MCLILFSYKQHAQYPLILAANRDEHYERPTAQAMPWTGHPTIIGGRDLKVGGTWLGMTRSGRWAALTNVRDKQEVQMSDSSSYRSRGELVGDYLKNEVSPLSYLQQIRSNDNDYRGYNLLLGDSDSLSTYSNRTKVIETIAPGIFGLSNAYLDAPWPKVMQGKEGLKNICNNPEISDEEQLTQQLFQLLRHSKVADDKYLPRTGVSLEWERTLSPLFIKSTNYGTCSSSILIIDRNGMMTFTERSYLDKHDQQPVKTFRIKPYKHS